MNTAPENYKTRHAIILAYVYAEAWPWFKTFVEEGTLCPSESSLAAEPATFGLT